MKFSEFWKGAMFSLMFMALIQDWMGLEGYIEFVRDRWIDLPWWIWLLPITLLLLSLDDEVR